MSDAALRLDTFLPYRLAVASNAVSRLVAQVYEARFGLSIPEWRLIAVLGEGEALISQQILVRRTGMDKVAVSRAAGRLIQRGLIDARAGADARSRLLGLTGIGRSIYREIAPLALAVEARLFERLAPTERAVLAGLLSQIQAQAEAMLAEAAPRT